MDGTLIRRGLRATLLPVALGVATAVVALPSRADALDDAAALLPIDAEGPRMVVLGELHGTREAPALAEAVVRRWLEQREAVNLALEVPTDEQGRIDAFLDSPGDAASRGALLSGAFWTVPAERSDGRRSVAVVSLLDAARRLRGEGAALRVLAFDAGNAGGGADERNRRMARVLRDAMAADAAERFVVLIGNYHARRAPPTKVSGLMPGQTPPVPTMAHLLDLPMLRVNVTARTGEFWACMAGTCGPRPVGGRGAFSGAGATADATATFHPTPDDATGWDAQLQLPAFRVAKPAVP